MGVALRTTPGFTDLYVLFRGTSVAVQTTAGTSLDQGWYEAIDAAIAAAGLPIGVYSGAFLHGNYASPNALDLEEGVFTDFVWDGSATVDQLAASTLTIVGEVNSGFSDLTNKIGDPTITIAADIAAIQGGGTIIPVSQVAVPLSRKWILKQTSDGLVGEVPLVRFTGQTQTFGIDWRCDLATNGRLKEINSITVISGPTNGVTVSTDENDLGVDHSESKFKLTITTAGTYEIATQVTYDDADGGGTSDAVVVLEAV